MADTSATVLRLTFNTVTKRPSLTSKRVTLHNKMKASKSLVIIKSDEYSSLRPIELVFGEDKMSYRIIKAILNSAWLSFLFHHKHLFFYNYGLEYVTINYYCLCRFVPICNASKDVSDKT